jgi:hypothetical protein
MTAILLGIALVVNQTPDPLPGDRGHEQPLCPDRKLASGFRRIHHFDARSLVNKVLTKPKQFVRPPR